MADPEKGQPAETDETGTPPETKENPPAASEPDADPKPEAKLPEKEEPASPSVDDFSLDDLLERSDLKEHIERRAQSAGDSAAARAETRLMTESKTRETAVKTAAETAERKKLIADENFDEIGRQEAAKAEANERLMESLSMAGEVIGRATTERYSQELGEEAVDRIIKEQDAAGGNVIDLNRALAEESTKRAVEKATGTAIEEAEERFGKKLEATLTDRGVKERSKEAAETGPVEKVSGSQAEVKDTGEEDTYESMSEAYGKGEKTYEEFKPFKDAHDKARGK